ncbi:MAG: Crp/Fnr family transcriptional regulator [Proteobacteria bacterium]|nr:Crp/Fnr family transcriptional regulator [Pseudomonadota bacterium]
MGETIRKSLAGVALLAELSPERLAALERNCRWRRYAAKEMIFDLESEGTEVYFVVDGAVQIVNYSPSGREISFAQVPAGSYIGELSAIDRRPRSATVVAAEDTTLASISAATFQTLLLEHPKIALLSLHNLAQMVRAADERIMDLSTLSAINRVHVELLRMVSAEGPDANTGYIRPMPTHSDIASRASTTRETVSRVLSHLARVRILERASDEFRVVDIERLKHLIEPAGD